MGGRGGDKMWWRTVDTAIYSLWLPKCIQAKMSRPSHGCSKYCFNILLRGCFRCKYMQAFWGILHKQKQQFFFFFKTCMQVYDHNLILDYVNQGHSQLSCMLLTSNDVPWLGHHFKAISHFIHAISMRQQNQFLLLKTSDNTHRSHRKTCGAQWHCI